GVDWCLNAAAIIDLPALEFIQKRLVTDVQPSRGLLAVPACLLEDAQHELFFGLLSGARTDVLQGHVVFFRFDRNYRSTGLSGLFLELRHVQVHIGEDQIPLHGILELANITGPVISQKGVHEGWIDLIDGTLVAIAVPAEKVIAEHWNVFATFSQWRN